MSTIKSRSQNKKVPTSTKYIILCMICMYCKNYNIVVHNPRFPEDTHNSENFIVL